MIRGSRGEDTSGSNTGFDDDILQCPNFFLSGSTSYRFYPLLIVPQAGETLGIAIG